MNERAGETVIDLRLADDFPLSVAAYTEYDVLFVNPIFDEEGRLRGFIKIARDVTERKRAEEERLRLLGELEAERALLNSLLDNAPVGFGFFDHSSAWARRCSSSRTLVKYSSSFWRSSAPRPASIFLDCSRTVSRMLWPSRRCSDRARLLPASRRQHLKAGPKSSAGHTRPLIDTPLLPRKRDAWSPL